MLQRKPHHKGFKRSKKVDKWNSIRAQIKKDFEARDITRCEMCGNNSFLSFAHSKKRRFLYTDQDWFEVALLCQICHNNVEHSGHENMYNTITDIIHRRTTN